MIRRDDGELLAECDGCGACLYGGTQEDFRAFVAEIKEDGWQVRKSALDGGWEHYCPECQEG